MGTLSLLIAGILIGFAVFILVKTLMGGQISMDEQERLGIGIVKKQFPSPILKIVYPVVLRVLPSVVNWKIEKFRNKFRKKLDSAGMRDNFTPDEFYAFKVAFAFVLPVVVYVYNFVAGLGLQIMYAPIFAFFGWFYPELWLNGVIKKRQEDVKREMPFVVDLLTLCVEAGLDFGGSMAKVVEKGQPGPLRSEFETVLREIQLGAMRGEALKNMAERIDLKEMSSFVSVLVTAERMGSPVGDVLRAQSDAIKTRKIYVRRIKGWQSSD